MAKTVSPELIFGDTSLKVIDFASIFANPEFLGTVILWFFIAGGVWLVSRMGYVAVRDRRFDEGMVTGFVAMTLAILLIAPLLPVRLALELPKMMGIQIVVVKVDNSNTQYSTQPIGLGQWLIVAGYTLSDFFANHAALKLVSLNPLTAPQMPLLKAQAERYFKTGDEINQVAQDNIRITGGAFSSRDYDKHVIDGAGVAYASAGLNQAGHTRQNMLSISGQAALALLGGDRDKIKRLVWLWNENEAAAMAECVGNTLVSDYAFALNLAKSSSNDNPYAGYSNLPTDTSAEWQSYFNAANAYLYAGAGSSGVASSLGSRWAGGTGGETGSDIQLPPVTDIIQEHPIRERILNADAFRNAWAPGTDESELHLSSKSVESTLKNETDAQARANYTRLLAAVKAREVAESSNAAIVDSVTSAFEKIASAHAMANLSNQQVGGFLTILENGISIPEGKEVVKLINNDNAVDKCRTFGNRIKALNVGLKLVPASSGERYKEFINNLPDKGISAARQVASNGWMMLGVYYISTANTYQNFFDTQNDLNAEAAAASAKYMDSSPVAVQAGNMGVVGETAALGAGGVMARQALAGSGNTIRAAGSGATKFLGTAAGQVVRKVGILGLLTSVMDIWKDFSPYVVFVFVVMWWLLKLVGIFTALPYIVLVAAGTNIFGDPKSHQMQWIRPLIKKLMVLSFMPVVYVIGWGVIFFGVSILDVFIASTSGKASVSGAITSIVSGNFGQAGLMDTGIVPSLLKFVLGLAVSTVLLKVDKWVVEFIGHGSASDADMNTGPKPTNLSPTN